MKEIPGANSFDGAKVTINFEGPTVSVTAGYGYESGTTYLTPTHARQVARALIALADEIDAEAASD